MPRFPSTISDLEDAVAVPVVAGLARTEYAIGMVQVDRPATIRHRIRMVPLLDDVALRQHVFPFETAALPLAWYHPYPLKCHRLRLGEFPRVLDVIPDAVYPLPEILLEDRNSTRLNSSH